MSYGLKYKIELTNKNNKLVEIEMHEKDYTGSWVYLDSGATAPELVPDLSDHFRGTSLLFSVEATDDAGMPEFFVEDPRRYKVVMKHSGVVEFIGFLVPEVYEDPYVAAPFDIELTATDGLGLLKNIDFDLTGYHSDIACIDHILRKTGHELPVSVAVDVQYLGQPTMTLPAMAYARTNTAKFYSDKGDPDNCYDALKKILASYGLELYVTQWRNRWLVFRTIDLQGEFVTFTNAAYTSRGSLFAASNFGKNQPCDAVGSLNRSLNKRLHKVHISNKLGRKDSVLPLDVFEQELVRTFNRSNNRGGVTYMYNAKNWKWVGNAANDTTQWRWDYLRGALAFVVFPPYANNNLLNYIYYQSPQLAASGQPWVAAFDLQMERGADNGGAVNIPVDVQHVAGSTVRYLTESGWSSSPNPLKIEMTNQTVARGFQTPLPSGQYRILLPSIPAGGYIRFRLFRPAEHSAQYYAFSIRNLTLFEDLTTSPVPEFVNYDVKISDTVVNSEEIEVEGSAPEYPNSHLLFANVKMDPSMTSAPYDWIHKGDTSRVYPLAVVQMREIASNNRKPRQILSGRVDGVVASLAIIRDKTVPEEPLFWFKSGSWDLWNDAMDGTFEQLLPYQEQDLTISQMSVTENFSSSNSNNANAAQASAQTSSGTTAGTSSRSSSSWVNITGKPETFPPSAHTHIVSDVTGLQSALDAKAKKEGDITQDFHVKDLHIAGQVNQWLAQQLVVDDARIQVNRRQGGATVDSGLVIYNKDTSTEVSRLVYDIDGIWRAGGQRIYTDAYKPVADNATNLGGFSAASYPRKDENAYVSGIWTFNANTLYRDNALNQQYADHIRIDGVNTWIWRRQPDTKDLRLYSYGVGSDMLFMQYATGRFGVGTVDPQERIHAAGNGLFEGNLTAQGNLSAVDAALSGNLDVTGAGTFGGDLTTQGDLSAVNAALSGTLGVTAASTFGGNVGTSNFASQALGWRVTPAGIADFRHIYTDELQAKAFTADISQALVGSDVLTKSVAKLAQNWATTANGATSSIYVEELEGFPGFQVFAVGDRLLLRLFDRAGGGLLIKNIWATVASYVSTTNNVQRYTITVNSGGATGQTVYAGSMVLDYGTSGSGVIERTVLDAMGSPYSQVKTWVNDPSNPANYTIHNRTGNLDGIANASGFGFYGENTFLTGKLLVGDLTKAGQYMEYENGQLNIKGQITVTGGNAATKADVDAVQVGGRNLFFKSGFAFGTSGNAVTGWGTYGAQGLSVSQDNPITIPGVNTISWELSASNGGYYQRFRSPNGTSIADYYQQGQRYTVSAWLKASAPSTLRIVAEGVPGGTAVLSLTTEWQLYTHTFIGDPIRHTVSFYGYTQGVRYYLCMPKLELGNRATDWTPAPEDVDAGIAAAETSAKDYADGAAAAAESAAKTFATSEATAAESAAKDYTDDLTSRVENTLGLADLEGINQTLITGGKVRTALLEATEIAALVVTAETVEGLTLNFDKGTVGAWTMDNDALLSASNLVELNAVENKIAVRHAEGSGYGVELGDFGLADITQIGDNLTLPITTSNATTGNTPQAGHFTVVGGSGGYTSVSGRSSVVLADTIITRHLNSGGAFQNTATNLSNSFSPGALYSLRLSFYVQVWGMTGGSTMAGTQMYYHGAIPAATPGLSQALYDFLAMRNSGSQVDNLAVTVRLRDASNNIVAEQGYNLGAQYDGTMAGDIFERISFEKSFIAPTTAMRVEVTVNMSGASFILASEDFNNPGTYVLGQGTGRIDVGGASIDGITILRPNKTELSSQGFQVVNSSKSYFRVQEKFDQNFVEARGVQEFISPNGTYRLRVSDSGIQKSTNGGQDWTNV